MELYYQTEDGMQTIYCGNSFELLSLIEPESIDLMVTDPPYLTHRGGSSCRGPYKYRQKIREKDLDIGIDLTWLNKFSNWFCFCSKEQLQKVIEFAQTDNWMLLVWIKTNPVPLINNTYLPDCEYIIHKYSIGRLFGTYQDKSRVFISPIQLSKYDHPTVKPLPLIEKFLILGSQKEDTILDPYLGSGTTLVACQKLGRRGIGIEISEQYCEIAKNRLKLRKLK